MILKKINEYPGKTNDERVKSMLNDAKNHGFTIVPTVVHETGQKGYSAFLDLGEKEEAHMLPVNNWIEGFPKIEKKTMINIMCSKPPDGFNEKTLL
jgi:hypothetical protein